MSDLTLGAEGSYPFYTIQNQQQDNYLDGNSSCTALKGCDAQLWSQNGLNTQQWLIENGSEPNTKVLVNVNKSQCLDGDEALYQGNGTPVILWPCNRGAVQNWILFYDAGVYVIENSMFRGECLDGRMPGGVGSKVQLWGCGDTKNPAIQYWRIVGD